MNKTKLTFSNRTYEIHQFETLEEAQQAIGKQQMLALLNRGYHTRCRGKVQHAQSRGDTDEAIQAMLDDYLPQDAPNKAEVALREAIGKLEASNLTPEAKARLRAEYSKKLVSLLSD